MPSFNEEQLAAISHRDGACMVLAGPGSGKTTVITHRTKTLIEEEGIAPKNILVITFTKAAAVEMQERFLSLMNGEKLPVSFGTFHAVYFQILKYAYNYRAENIIREEQKYQIMREIIQKLELEIDDEGDFISNILSEISVVKGEMMDCNHYYSKNCGEEIFKNIYREYNQRLEKANLIDFDDMLVLCYELLRERQDILAFWQERYQYILVDEFQDINRIQYEALKLLALPQNNLFIVGDDDQSIYRFRGARPEIMLNFEKDYPETKRILLDINYRCSGEIVKAAGKLIRNNKKRFEKDIRASHEDGEKIKIGRFSNVYEESEAILSHIAKYIEQGYGYRDIAVLYRTNTNPRMLVEKMMERNLPFCMKDMLPNIYEHFIAKDIFAYIHAAQDFAAGRLLKRDDVLRIINKPKRYISRSVFVSPLVDFEEVKRFYQDKDYVLQKISKLEYDLKMLSNRNPYAVIAYIKNVIGYDKFIEEYAEYRRIRPEELYDVIDELMEGAKAYRTLDEWFVHIEEYGEELKKQAKNRWEKKEGIELATMHSAKGLEYKVVFVIDANESVTPHKKALFPEDIEEERRLFYVAMTRAKETLFLYYCRERYGKEAEMSRFLEEILTCMDDVTVGKEIVHRKYGNGVIKRVSEGKILVFFENTNKEMLFDAKMCLSKGIIKFR